MPPTIFTAQARKTSVSRDASDHFHRKSFQNDRFVRGFLEISQHKLPKRSFRARLPRNFKEQASKKIVSCEASSKFHSTSSQNERFARCLRQFSQKKLPKRSFRARLPRNFKEQASKKIVSCEASSKFHSNKLRKTNVSRDASDNFHRKSFQNDRSTSFQKDRFVRRFLEISQNKLPQNERFVRGFLEISQNKLRKTNVSRDASDNFHRKFAFRHSFVPSTHRILREGSSSKSKMCVSLQRRAIPHFKIHVLLQRRTQKCMNPAQEARGNTRHTKITILPQFRTSDQHEVTRGLQNELQNSHFTSVLDVR